MTRTTQDNQALESLSGPHKEHSVRECMDWLVREIEINKYLIQTDKEVSKEVCQMYIGYWGDILSHLMKLPQVQIKKNLEI